MEDADLARLMTLRRIFHIDRRGTVDGVEVDLRHELLDPREWKTNVFGDMSSMSRRKHVPLIWFPAYGEFSEEKLRSYFIQCIVDFRKKHSIRETYEYDVDDDVLRNTPDCIVYEGDKICIDKLTYIKIGDGLGHPHDSEAVEASLKVIRRDGECHNIKNPLLFARKLSYFALYPEGDFLEIIINRICDKYKVSDISAWGDIFKEIESNNIHERLVLMIAGTFDMRLKKIVEHMSDDELASKDHTTASETWRFMTDGVMLGYLWAQIESELGMKPLAESALRMKAGGSWGGSKSGEARRNKRARTWEPHARELAVAIRHEQPSFSQDRVASEIVTRWKEANFEPPGHKTLKGLLSQMERDGQLPTRKTS